MALAGEIQSSVVKVFATFHFPGGGEAREVGSGATTGEDATSFFHWKSHQLQEPVNGHNFYLGPSRRRYPSSCKNVVSRGDAVSHGADKVAGAGHKGVEIRVRE